MKWFLWTVVIVIVALYVSAMGPCPTGRHRTARAAKVIVEVDHLSQAMQAYKERQVQFPPCLTGHDSLWRKERFMQHLSTAYPNGAYGTTADAYDTLNKHVGEDWKYNFALPDGTLAPLNLDSLDPAESLVFWLAGFPTPISTTTKLPVAGRKMFCFHRDSDNPFKRDEAAVEGLEPLRFRTEPNFQFDPLRLVDNDADGWPEYVPYQPASNLKSPYVYFDAPAYIETTKRLDDMGTCAYPRDLRLMREWGSAVPYLLQFDANQPERSRWAKDTSFQVICAGLDGKYGSPMPRLAVFPALDAYDAADGFQKPHAVDKSELDNLANLSNRNLGQAKQESEPNVPSDAGMNRFIDIGLIVGFLALVIAAAWRVVGGRGANRKDRLHS